jgi:hypothetical protein
MWKRLRLLFWRRICGFTRETALDLMDGIDAGDSVSISWRLLIIRRRRSPTPEALARLDAEFLAGGPVRDKVAGKVLDDIRRRETDRRIAAQYLTHKN